MELLFDEPEPLLERVDSDDLPLELPERERVDSDDLLLELPERERVVDVPLLELPERERVVDVPLLDRELFAASRVRS